MTPKQSNCMPPIIQIDATVEVQPPIVKPVYFRIMKTISAIKLTKNIKNPKQVIIRIGLILKEVIPSNANANILLKGYLDSPANLLSLSYSFILIILYRAGKSSRRKPKFPAGFAAGREF